MFCFANSAVLHGICYYLLSACYVPGSVLCDSVAVLYVVLTTAQRGRDEDANARKLIRRRYSKTHRPIHQVHVTSVIASKISHSLDAPPLTFLH